MTGRRGSRTPSPPAYGGSSSSGSGGGVGVKRSRRNAAVRVTARRLCLLSRLRLSRLATRRSVVARAAGRRCPIRQLAWPGAHHRPEGIYRGIGNRPCRNAAGRRCLQAADGRWTVRPHPRAGPKLLRVQCKWAPRRGDVVLVRCYSSRRAREGLRRRCYSAAEVDVIAAYCDELNRCFLISADRFDGRLELTLRIAQSRNNQRDAINWADDFDFGARLEALLGP